ncbi:phage minor head protein [Sporanaerobacter acetigenes]|uniref:phage minor head protein n=1 Tax=Sporanaerobacter acetigenes TaxID=165813 RepID=UPI00104AB7B9|nr:phage minor head protein [Sporanaerobacter acetigenes]
MTKLDKEFISLQNQIEKMSRMRETTVARNHKKVLYELRKRLAKLYEQYEIDGQLTYDEMVKYNRLQKLDKEVEMMINELYKDNTKLIRGHLTSIAEETSLYTIEVVEGATQRRLKGIVKEIDVSKTINDEMAGLRWTGRMGKHRADVIWDIQKEIKRGLTQGDTYGAMAKRLKKELEISTSKCNTIVRTESHRVHAQAKVESLDSIARHGVKMTKKWNSSKDERVRSQHSEMDGVEIPYEDDFILPDGAKGIAPGLIGQPQHDINCRCILTIDIVDNKNINEPDFLRISNKDDENIDTVDTIRKELDLVPEKHREIIKDTAKEITIVSEGNSRYDRNEGIIYILENPDKGEVVHELGHAIETKLDLYHDDEFLKILNNGLENINLSNFEEDHSYPNSIWKLTGVDKFISDYQSRLYDNDIDGKPRIDYANMTINTKTLGEYFSEGYSEYIKNPDNLKHKDESLYNFIKGRIG